MKKGEKHYATDIREVLKYNLLTINMEGHT